MSDWATQAGSACNESSHTVRQATMLIGDKAFRIHVSSDTRTLY